MHIIQIYVRTGIACKRKANLAVPVLAGTQQGSPALLIHVLDICPCLEQFQGDLLVMV